MFCTDAPVSAAVAVETLKIYEERNILGQVRDVMPVFQKELRRFADHPLVGECRGVGLVGAVELAPVLLLGFVVVSAPLVVALINATFSVQRLAGMSESVVDQAAQAARGSRLLMEQVLSMERVVRQYVILDDAGLLDDYDKIRAIK